MEGFFAYLINGAIQSAPIIITVILIRFFKKLPRRSMYLLWFVVFLRLLLPFSLETAFSVFPNEQPFIYYKQADAGKVLSENLSIYGSARLDTPVNSLRICSIIWIVVALLMLTAGIIAFISLRRLILDSTIKKDGTWENEKISTPFVLGMIKPRIYVPSSINESTLEYALMHEKAHLKHFDNIIKPVLFIVLCIYWFNPLMWLAYVLFLKDMELSADETVIEKLSKAQRKEYAEALLRCSINQKGLNPYPIAFSSANVKQRIKHVIFHKKALAHSGIAIFLICAVLASLFFTKGVSAKENGTILRESFPEEVLIPKDVCDANIIDTLSCENELYVWTENDTNTIVYYLEKDNGNYILKSKAEGQRIGNDLVYEFFCAHFNNKTLFFTYAGYIYTDKNGNDKTDKNRTQAQRLEIEFSNGQKAEFSELDKKRRLMFIVDGNVKIKNMRVFGLEELTDANIVNYKSSIPIYEANEYSKG
jgi:beta-lactamase regulating signal transducer with metallopeptidase domain